MEEHVPFLLINPFATDGTSNSRFLLVYSPKIPVNDDNCDKDRYSIHNESKEQILGYKRQY